MTEKIEKTEQLEKLESIIKDPTAGAATACVIWLHGLGANGHDFAQIIPELGLPEDHTIRFIFPHAPRRAVTLNKGMRMPAWFDIIGLTLEARQDAQGIELAQQQLCQMMEEQHAQGIAYKRIFLFGFSQGGALALYTALKFSERLGGVAGLSTYFPMQENVGKAISETNRALPIFLAHGTVDPILSLALAKQSLGALENMGLKPEWHTYPMPHSVSPEELIDLGEWLARNLN